MSDLLKQAIADAKAVRATALSNAKAALEEHFAPKLQSMLSAILITGVGKPASCLTLFAASFLAIYGFRVARPFLLECSRSLRVLLEISLLITL